MLYLVATPIGNLADLSFRALETLLAVDLILCEDTRQTANLLKRYQPPGQPLPPLWPYYQRNEERLLPLAMTKLTAGQKLALVSNSGTPNISDPGFRLVRACQEQQIPVSAVPGPCAPVAALAISGLPTDKFIFLGFLPKKTGAKEQALRQIKSLPMSTTVVILESPFRLKNTLVKLQELFGDMEIVLAKELTKVHEQVTKNRLSALLATWPDRGPKGEFVVLFRYEA